MAQFFPTTSSRCIALFQGKKSQETFKEDVKKKKKSTVVYNANLTMKSGNKRSARLFDLENGSKHKHKKIHDSPNLQWSLGWIQFAKR